jgi:hypothetical protein
MHQAPFYRLPVQFVGVATAEFVIGSLLREQRVDHDEKAMRHRDGGAFRATARRQPPTGRA